MWQVCYEVFNKHQQVKGSTQVCSKADALEEFNRLYEEYENISIAIYDPNNNIIQSCTKGYE